MEEDRAKADAEAAALARKEARRQARARGRADAGRQGVAQPAVEALGPEPFHAEEPRPPRRVGRGVAIALVALVAVALAGLNFAPIDAGSFERAASARLGEPVRIGSIRLSVMPLPRLRMENVAVGAGGEIRIAGIEAAPDVGAIWNEKKHFGSVTLDGVSAPAGSLAALLWGKGSGDSLRIDSLVVKGARLQLPGVELPVIDATGTFGGGGNLEQATITARGGKFSVKVAAKGASAQVEISAGEVTFPFGGTIRFDDFRARGVANPAELALSEIEASALGGVLRGNARLRWTPAWSVEGQMTGRGIDPARFAAPLVASGSVEGRFAYSMRSPTPERLASALRYEGSFTMHKGTLGTVDLTRVLQGADSPGGTTLFSEMSGSFAGDLSRVQLRRVRLGAGMLSASGDLAVGPQKNLSGRFDVELRNQARAAFVLGGTLPAPVVRR
ncbi:MAG: hypothetical protein IT514_07930 [Burkholderiales bacterium]|nr:hypothetical protein [Burkholderiales bacterium]